jgi:hypothetical protein
MVRGAKTNHTPASLTAIWAVTQAEAKSVAEQLVEVGFFEARGSEYWVPFLYRNALELVQDTDE